MGAGGEVEGNGLEAGGGFAEGGKCSEGVGDKLTGIVKALLDTEDGGPGGLDLLGVFAGGFAKLGGVLGQVEDVVDDLEGEASFFAEGAKACDGIGGGSGEIAAGDDGDGDEGSCLGAVDALDEIGGGLYSFRFDVHDLSADHAGGQPSGEIVADAGGDGVRDLAKNVDRGLGGDGKAGDCLEGEGLEGVAGEDGGGFSEYDVAGGQAAAEIVVVEGGKVVVDEGIGVEHLEGCAEFDGGGLVEAGAGDHARGFEGEDGAQALAAGEDTVAHGAVDGVRWGACAGKQALEGAVGEGGTGLECLLNVVIHVLWMIDDERTRRGFARASPG